ncbi:MAG: hypothetical protein WAT93_14330 [Pontixanthobacter sp.]
MQISRRITLRGIALPLAVLCGLVAACSPSKTREQAALEFEQGLLAEPGTSPFWEAVKQEFPEEFAKLVNRGVEAELGGTLSQDQGLALGREWLTGLESKHGAAIKFAPEQSLTKLVHSTVDLIVVFEDRDQQSCAKLALGDSFDTSSMSPRIQSALQRNKVDRIRAMAGGIKTPVTRTDPMDADFAALFAGMRALGASERIMDLLTDDRKLAAASPRDQCTIGVILYRAMAQLPNERAARLGAFMLVPPDPSQPTGNQPEL